MLYWQDEQTLDGVAVGNMQIMATFNSAAAAAASAPDYNPPQSQQQIQQQCEGIQRDVVDNIRACGDAHSQVSGRETCIWVIGAAQQKALTPASVCCTAQERYEAACTALFVALDKLDQQLSNQRYTTISSQIWRLQAAIGNQVQLAAFIERSMCRRGGSNSNTKSAPSATSNMY